MKVLDVHYNVATGETEERWIEIPGVLTVEQAAEEDRLQAIRDANAAIKEQLATNDARIIRAAIEAMSALAAQGVAVVNADRLAAHVEEQAALRAGIKPVIT